MPSVIDAGRAGVPRIRLRFGDGKAGVADLAPGFLCFLAFGNEPELQELFRKRGYLTGDFHAV